MSDNRPSIAELQRLCRDESENHDANLANAAPVLLEIAAAALRSIGPCDPRCEDGYHAGSCVAHAGRTELVFALSKVAP